MRDPKRIPEVLARIREIWEKYPDLRLMQLLGNLFDEESYYVEDDALLARLDNTYQEEQS